MNYWFNDYSYKNFKTIKNVHTPILTNKKRMKIIQNDPKTLRFSFKYGTKFFKTVKSDNFYDIEALSILYNIIPEEKIKHLFPFSFNEYTITRGISNILKKYKNIPGFYLEFNNWIEESNKNFFVEDDDIDIIESPFISMKLLFTILRNENIKKYQKKLSEFYAFLTDIIDEYLIPNKFIYMDIDDRNIIFYKNNFYLIDLGACIHFSMSRYNPYLTIYENILNLFSGFFDTYMLNNRVYMKCINLYKFKDPPPFFKIENIMKCYNNIHFSLTREKIKFKKNNIKIYCDNDDKYIEEYYDYLKLFLKLYVSIGEKEKYKQDVKNFKNYLK